VLILVIVLLFTGFPRAFSVMMMALHIPLSAMLIGLSFAVRPSYFANTTPMTMRSNGDGARSWHRELFTPFFQGLTLGALATGQIRYIDGRLLTGFFTGWLSPFAMSCGFSRSRCLRFSRDFPHG